MILRGDHHEHDSTYTVPWRIPAQLVANAALSLLNLACYLLDRQLISQAATFEKEGGFTERLYRVRAIRTTAWGGRS